MSECFLFFVIGLWVSDSFNEWKRGEPWKFSACVALFLLGYGGIILLGKVMQ